MPSSTQNLSTEDAPLGTVSIRPGVSVLSVLRHLNYKPWFALAEFVDNALQSYSANREALELLHANDHKLRVRIDVDGSRPASISIKDNAAGIARTEFPRAFRPAAIPTDRSGLSEFGMGMKSAACWFAPRWSVRTTALGEPLERTVRFDVERIVNDQIEELTIDDFPADTNLHFTEIVLEDLHHVPVKRTISKIKAHLRDIYRVFIRDGLLELYFGGDLMSYEEPSILCVASVRAPESTPRMWRKDIHFDFGDGLSVRGFAALRDPGSFAKSGFALFRRRRLIQGSADEGYKPRFIFGQPGSHRSLRLFGELHLEGFEISHTKDGFRWDENEQPFLELLRDHLNESELPLLRQADEYRVLAARNERKLAAQQAISKATEAMERALPEVLPRVAAEPPVDTRTEPLDAQTPLASKELAIRFRDRDWTVKVELTYNPAEGQWLSMSDQPSADGQPEVVEIRLSLAHPFMVRFAQTDSEDVEALLRVAAALALSEKLAREAGHRYTGTIRRNLNDILREALSQP